MTASFTLKRPDVFPAGTKVDCYELPASVARPLPGAADPPPAGSAAASGTVNSAGAVTFAGLNETKRHVVVAEVGFTVELLDGDGVLLGTVVATKPRPFSIAVVGGTGDGDWTDGVSLSWGGGTPTVIPGPADLDDVIAWVADQGGVLTLAAGVTAADGPVADGSYASVIQPGSGGYRRVYFRTPTAAAAQPAVPTWRARRTALGLS